MEPKSIIAALQDVPWIIGRYWIDHDINISLIGNIVHIFTSLILLFGAYLLIFGILWYQYNVICITLITFIIFLCILHSFYSKLLSIIIFTLFYQIMISLICYSFNIYINSQIMVIIISLIILCIFFMIQIIFCHKYCMGSIPNKTEPKWFPFIIDILIKQFNEPYLLIMLFTFHYQWFDIDPLIIKKAKYFKTLYTQKTK